MFNIISFNNYQDRLAALYAAVSSNLKNEDDIICGLSQVSAIINVYLDRINWAGFYLIKNGELILGPFQGLPACTRIQIGRGVCGTAAKEEKMIVVEDVDAFPGHIACDSASRSEIVLPIFRNGDLFGVLDIDSPEPARFTKEDAECLDRVAEMITDFVSRV